MNENMNAMDGSNWRKVDEKMKEREEEGLTLDDE